MNKFILVLFLLPFISFSKDKVTLYTYHDKAPFIIDKSNEKGISFGIADILSKHSDKYEFVTKYYPRKRLDQMKKKIILWSNPNWVGDREERIFLWSESIMKDKDVVVSLEESSLDYKGPKSLLKKSLACVRGYKYFGLEEYFNEEGISRLDLNAEKQILDVVASKRVDAGIVSYSALGYYKSQNAAYKTIAYSKVAQDEYIRRIQFTSNYTLVFNEIQRIIKSKDFKKDLKNLYSKYNLSF